MSAVGNADGEAVGKENPLTPRSILRRNKVGGSPANGSVQKRVTFEESCLIESKKAVSSGGGRLKPLRKSSIPARTPHRKKSFSRTASLLRPQARSMTSPLAMASPMNDDASNDGLSPRDLLAGEWCRGIAKGLSESSSGAGSCNGSGVGRRRSGLPLPSSRGHRMFQVQEALNRAACVATSTTAAVSTPSSPSLENDGSIGCDDALPRETRTQQLGRRGLSLASPTAAQTGRAHRSCCCRSSPPTSLEIAKSGHLDSGSMRVAGSAQSVDCASGGGESGISGNDTGKLDISGDLDCDSIDTTTGASPVATAAATCASGCPPFIRGEEETRGATVPSPLLKQQQHEGYSGRRPPSSREDIIVDMLEKNGSDDKNCSAVCGEGGQDSSPMRDSRGNVKTSGALTSRKFMHVDDPGAAATRLASEGDGLVSCNKDGRAGPLATGSQSSLGKKTAEPESNDLGRYSEVGGEVSLRCEQASDSSLPLMTGAEIEDGVEDAGPGSSPPSRSMHSVPVVSPFSDAAMLLRSSATVASIPRGGANNQASERSNSGTTRSDIHDVKGRGGSEDHSAEVEQLQKQERRSISGGGGDIDASELSWDATSPPSALRSLSADSAGSGSCLGPTLVEESPLFSPSGTFAAEAQAAAEAATTVSRLLGRSDGKRGNLEDEDVDDASSISEISADDYSTSSCDSAPAEPLSPSDPVFPIGEAGDDPPSNVVPGLGSSKKEVAPSSSCDSVEAAPEAEANTEKKKTDLPETSREPSRSADSSVGCVEDSGGARGEEVVFVEERRRKRGRGRPGKFSLTQDSEGKAVTSESSPCSSNRGRVTPVCTRASGAVENGDGCTADVEVCIDKPSLASRGEEKGGEGGIVCGWMTLACPSWPRFLAGKNINADPDMDGTLAVACGSSRRTAKLTVSPSRKRKLMSRSASNGVRGRGVKRKSTALCVEPATKVRCRHEGVKKGGIVKGETKEGGSWVSGWLSPTRKF